SNSSSIEHYLLKETLNNSNRPAVYSTGISNCLRDQFRPVLNYGLSTSLLLSSLRMQEILEMSNNDGARLAARSASDEKTVIELRNKSRIGENEIFIIAGPCSVESVEQMQRAAAVLKHAPIQALRGGAFKPRTSPYSFQGLGLNGLTILSEIGSEFDMPVV